GLFPAVNFAIKFRVRTASKSRVNSRPGSGHYSWSERGFGGTEASSRRSQEGSTSVAAATSARATPVAPERKLGSADQPPSAPHPPAAGRQAGDPPMPSPSRFI